MNKKLTAGVVVALALIAGAVLWRSHDTTIRSADGTLELDIPAGALPDGIHRSDVSIQSSDGTAFFGASEAPGPVYELLPDGLTLSKPATLRLSAGADGVIPQALHVSSSGSVELLNPTRVTINAAGEKAVTEFAISHFSKVGMDIRHGTFRYEFTTGGTATVGTQLAYALTITVDTHNHWFDNGIGYEPDIDAAYHAARWKSDADALRTNQGFFYRVAPGTAYTVAAFQVSEAYGNILSPHTLDVPMGDQKEYVPYRFAGRFTCEKPGRTQVSIEDAVIDYRMLRNTDGKDTFQSDQTVIILIAEDYSCTAPEGPTQTPTPRVELREDAIEYRGHYLPVSGLRVGPAHAAHGDGPGCPEPHWHVDAKVTALDGTVFVDPSQGGCGFGTLTEHPVVKAVQY